MKYWKEFALIYGGCTFIGLCSGSLVVWGTFTGLAGILHGLLSIVIKATEPRQHGR
jgi:hypothetical protein